MRKVRVDPLGDGGMVIGGDAPKEEQLKALRYQQLVDFSELSGRIDDLRRELGRPPAQDLRPGSGA